MEIKKDGCLSAFMVVITLFIIGTVAITVNLAYADKVIDDKDSWVGGSSASSTVLSSDAVLSTGLISPDITSGAPCSSENNVPDQTTVPIGAVTSAPITSVSVTTSAQTTAEQWQNNVGSTAKESEDFTIPIILLLVILILTIVLMTGSAIITSKKNMFDE